MDGPRVPGSKKGKIPQFTGDKPSPSQEDMWVAKSGGVGTLMAPGIVGLCLNNGGSAASYELRYRTQQGTTVGVTLT